MVFFKGWPLPNLLPNYNVGWQQLCSCTNSRNSLLVVIESVEHEGFYACALLVVSWVFGLLIYKYYSWIAGEFRGHRTAQETASLWLFPPLFCFQRALMVINKGRTHMIKISWILLLPSWWHQTEDLGPLKPGWSLHWKIYDNHITAQQEPLRNN